MVRLHLKAHGDVPRRELGQTLGSHAQRIADALAHSIAFEHKPLTHVLRMRRVDGLVVGGVQRGLIVIHEHARAGG